MMGGYILEDGHKLQADEYIKHLHAELQTARERIEAYESVPAPQEGDG